MTQDDLALMYQKANGWSPAPYKITMEELERFAQRVIAHERENVSKWVIDRGYATGHGDTIEGLLKELEWQIRESEREACARVCEDNADDLSEGDWDSACLNCAKHIRSRGT